MRLAIARIDEGIKRIEEERQTNRAGAGERNCETRSREKTAPQKRNQAKATAEVCVLGQLGAACPGVRSCRSRSFKTTFRSARLSPESADARSALCRNYGHADRVGATQTRPHEFGAFVRKARPFCHNSCRERFEIGRRRIKRVQIGKLFQKIAIGSFALLNTPLHVRELSCANLRSGSSPGCAFEGAAFSLLRVSQLRSPAPARFAGVLLQFVLCLRQSARSAARLLFAPVPVSLVQRSRCAARESSLPALFPRVRG